MTTEGFREVDGDLLADYLGGALDGTPQQEEVARLVSTDPAWVEAYAQLATAMTEVRASLARWAEPSPEMPQAIVDRLSAALAAAEPTSGGLSTEHRVDVGDASSTPPVVPAQGRPGRRPTTSTTARPVHRTSTGPGRRWRERVRRGGPVAAVTVAVVAVALGLTQLSGSVSHDTGVTALNQPASAPDGVAGAGTARTTGPALRSGTDYTPQTLGNEQGSVQSAPNPSRAAGNTPGAQPEADAGGSRRPMTDGLDQLARLTDETALTTCLSAVTAEHGNGPLVIEVMDYARFQGEPALVIRFTDATGARWAWVSGAECGVPGSGSDSRYSARVG
ncbi:hypothetical protein O7614_01420 [Micromonospora sp. WMMD961]|uniref:hypothetical protein n=1 Tax=Micromonospora sp. WMMD961 TaxID=3016100 RepID=UPI002416FF04|nr:hypothetical protein [Micromonospora sp. WMMD961]MDG4778306.1 hypothetical protein [Micromonospora sp. WMMD961]